MPRTPRFARGLIHEPSRRLSSDGFGEAFAVPAAEPRSGLAQLGEAGDLLIELGGALLELGDAGVLFRDESGGAFATKL